MKPLLKLKTLLPILIFFSMFPHPFNVYAENYAVLISAGKTIIDDDPEHTSEYWYDLFLMYELLYENGFTNFNHDNIYVLYGEGVDFSSNHDRYQVPSDDWDINQITDKSNTKSNIQSTFNALTRTITDKDFLWVWWMGHGLMDGPQPNIKLKIENRTDVYVTDDEFASYVDVLTNYKRRSFSFAACHSEGMFDDLENDKTVILVSSPMGDFGSSIETDVWHAEFNDRLFSALKWKTPGGSPVNADYNSNGLISMQEGFDYCFNNKIYDWPMYNDLGGIGHNMYIFSSGHITRNTHILDDIDFTGDIYIDNGVNLDINSDASICFEDGVNLYVSGNISAIGTSSEKIYFQGLNGANWGSVKVYSDNNNFEYCVFDGGKYNLYLNSSSGNEIAYCEFINGQYYGIRLYNSSADITKSYIHDNDNDGISLNYASPLLLDNTIEQNSNNGICCTGYCEPALVQYNRGGYNIIEDNSHDGMIVSYYSDALLGMITYQGFGHNSIFDNNNYDLKVYNHSSAYAVYNWWGTPNPHYSQFYCDWTSSLNYGYPLGSHPGGGSPLSKTSANSSNPSDFDVSDVDYNNPEELYQLAWHYRFIERDITSALETNKLIVENFPESEYARKALTQIFHISVKNNIEGLKDYLKSLLDKNLPKQTQGTVFDLLILKHIIDNDFKEAESLCLDVIEKFSDSNSEIMALYHLVVLYNNQLADPDLAAEYCNTMKTKYPDDNFTYFAREEMGEDVDWSMAKPSVFPVEEYNETSVLPIPKVYALRSNFPNPFNPATSVEFSLPKNSIVDISIYNSLGQLVKNVSYNSISAGVHQFVWDGKNYNGGNMSSGLYILHFSAQSLEADNETFSKSIKLLLVR